LVGLLLSLLFVPLCLFLSFLFLLFRFAFFAFLSRGFLIDLRFFIFDFLVRALLFCALLGLGCFGDLCLHAFLLGREVEGGVLGHDHLVVAACHQQVSIDALDSVLEHLGFKIYNSLFSPTE